MKLLGIDYGKKRVGIAYSEGMFATGLVTVSPKALISKLNELLISPGFNRIILGRPSGRLEAEVERLGEELIREFHVEVVFYDETLTTHDANAQLAQLGKSQKSRHAKADEVAAALLLQSYIDEQNQLTQKT